MDPKGQVYNLNSKTVMQEEHFPGTILKYLDSLLSDQIVVRQSQQRDHNFKE